jgi:hypothetical protein
METFMSETPAKKTAAPRKVNPKKVKAAAVEALDGRPSFEHRGLTFVLPEPKDFPLQVLLTNDEIEATRLILGDDQWNAYLESGPTIADFAELAQKMSEAQGMEDETGN